MIKVFSNIEQLKEDWEHIELPLFLKREFLAIYYANHPQIKHLFVTDEQLRKYAHIFKINFTKTKHYRAKFSLSAWFLRTIQFDVLYLTNAYITNVPAFVHKEKITLKELLSKISSKYSLVVIPDFLYDQMRVEDNAYTKIEVEEEMVVDIRKNWHTMEDYIANLKRKYRNKVKNIVRQTNEIEIKPLSAAGISNYANVLQVLFDQVASSSNFKGPEFNTASFVSFVEKGFMRVDGYFFNQQLVGFSSVMEDEDRLYSYFVGFDKQLNTTMPIYGRILLENIANAIQLKKEKLILGRTANEFKSNFGAYPIRSFVYVKIQNRLLRRVLNPFLQRVSIKPWTMRSPFSD